MLRKNCFQHLQVRLERLFKAGKIEFSSNNTIDLCIIGDAGGGFTKIGINVINARHANNPHNILLVGLYEGGDSAENIRSCFSEFSMQLPPLNTEYTLNGTHYRVNL